MNKLSGHKNTDMLILMNLNDSELGKVCSVNKYINSICENTDFWNMRIRMLLNVSEDELHELRRYLHMDGKELYVYLVSWKYIDRKYTDVLILFLLKHQDYLNEVIEKIVIKSLPKYINKEELIYYLRGDIAKMVIENNIMTRPGFKSGSFPAHAINIQTGIKGMPVPYSLSVDSFLDKYVRKKI